MQGEARERIVVGWRAIREERSWNRKSSKELGKK